MRRCRKCLKKFQCLVITSTQHIQNRVFKIKQRIIQVVTAQRNDANEANEHIKTKVLTKFLLYWELCLDCKGTGVVSVQSVKYK